MPSLYCSRCGLRTKLTPASLLLENCPRCMGRSGTVAPLVVSSSARPAFRQPASADPQPASPQTPPALTNRSGSRASRAQPVRGV
jgi:hypothetical protein